MQFKYNKLCGTKPSDFQLTSLRCRGVAKNAARSLCVLNETLLWMPSMAPGSMVHFGLPVLLPAG